MRCDYIAEGVIKAAKELKLTVPLIVRLKGTKEAEAKAYVFPILSESSLLNLIPTRMIKKSGLTIIPFDSLDDAAMQAVKLAT